MSIENVNEHENKYNYNVIDYLETDIDIFLKNNIEKYNSINICAYEVNNDGKHPFLKFLLTKNMFVPYFTFPNIEFYSDISSTQLYNLIVVQLFGLLLLEDFENFKNTIKILGFYEFENEVFLFINLTDCKLILNDVYYTTNTMFALVDEIINHKNICNITIDEFVGRFFLLNHNFCYLNDINNNKYEIPIVGYVGTEEKKLNFTYIFGSSKQNKSSILGPYFYFTNFTNAIKDALYNLVNSKDSSAKQIKNDTIFKSITEKINVVSRKCGIVRFALFLGLTKYIENSPNDNIDESQIKLQRLEDNNLDQQHERLTMRISDYDGQWADTYDSCYLGDIELDNGEKIQNSPLFVLKEYIQQIPLSYHYIDKTNHMKIL